MNGSGHHGEFKLLAGVAHSSRPRRKPGVIRSRPIRTLTLAVALLAACAQAHPPPELRFAISADPKTFDPLLATEAVSETIRYLTGGVLIRFNRKTQQFEPELAT